MWAPTEHLTSRQDGYLIVQAQDSGLFEILPKAANGTSAEVVAGELIVAAHRTGTFHKIIAGRLVADDAKWTAKDAEANAEFFADLSEPEDKAQLAAAFVEVLQDFFLSAARSLTPSATSSPRAPSGATSSSSDADSSTSPQAATDGPSVPASSPTATATV